MPIITKNIQAASWDGAFAYDGTVLDVATYTKNAGNLTFNISENIKSYKINNLKIFPVSGSDIYQYVKGSYIETDSGYLKTQINGEWTTIDVSSDYVSDNSLTYRIVTANSDARRIYGWYGYKLNDYDNENLYVPYVTIEYIIPNISNFIINGDCIDSQIICTWTQEHTTSWKVEAIKNNVVKSTKTGTSSTSCTFEPGDLVEGGNYTFKITCYYNETSIEESEDVTLSYTQANASIIDIPGTNINVDEKLTISWVSENQTSFSLSLDGKTYTGTTEKSITLPGGTISKGTKTINLTVTFSNSYYSNSDSIYTTFTAYGKPDAPTIKMKSIISSALPVIKWESTEQTSYLVTIKKLLETIETSGETLSKEKTYQTVTTLENSTTYTVYVKVKNQYGLWSDETEFEFSTQFIVPNAPTIKSISNTTEGSIILNVSTDIEEDTEYKNTEIWKREPLGEWKRMAYNLSEVDVWEDFYVGSNVEYEYKARNIGKSGGISESDVITTSTVVKGYTFYSVENLNNKFLFKYDVDITPKLITNIVTNLFAGASAPQTITNNVMYWKYNISFKTTNRNDILNLINLMKTAKVLLFKDCRGHKIFGNVVGNPSLTESYLGIIKISIEFTETSFLEENVYRGNNTGLSLIRWDGTWMFNGTQSYHS